MTEWGIASAVTVPRPPLVLSLQPILRQHLVHSRLMRALLGACPPDLEVLSSPTDVELADGTVLRPDLLVLRRADLCRRRLDAPPLLAVEMASPRSTPVERALNRKRYERAAVPSYWLVDPAALRVTIWELRSGAYDDVADVGADQQWSTSLPFPMVLRPGELAD